MLGNNWLAMVVTLVIALGWLRLNDFLAHKGFFSGRLSRKIIHIGTGPIFVLCWFLFPQNDLARYFAAVIPLGITIQFILVGLGVLQDKAAVDAMTRNGDRKEILFGPTFYGIIFVVMTLVYWYDSPIGIIALMLMCGGDGFADIIGRKFGKVSLPWAKNKTFAGSLAMFLGGWIFSIGVLAVYVTQGYFTGSVADYILPTLLIAFVGMLVESLPVRDFDNITVTLAAALIGHLVF